MGRLYDYRKLGAVRHYRKALRVSPWEQVKTLVDRYYHVYWACPRGRHWMKFGARGCVYCGKRLEGQK
jgi:hypothetical protein